MSRSLVVALGLALLGAASFLMSAEPKQNAALKAAPKIPQKLLEQRLQAARSVFEADLKVLQSGQMAPDERLIWWAERWVNAELALIEKPADRTAALKTHVKRLEELERIFANYAKTGQGREADAQAATYFRLETEIQLLEAGVE